MIKKIIMAVLTLMLAIPAFCADVVPVYTTNLNAKTFGVFQVDKLIELHKEPDENSKIVKTISWTKDKIMPEDVEANKVFVVFIPSKELALMAVSDEVEGWVEVIYNSKTGAKGWVKKDDPYKFMTWVNFYNSYGKKYGLYILKGAPEITNDLHSATEETSQVVARLNYPERINLNVIRGNWALVSVVDLDRKPKTGYLRWRSDDGIKYLFPAVK